MSIEVSPETELRLTEAARRQGISVDALLDRFLVDEAVADPRTSDKNILPTYDLGVIGALHRRDIYDDVP